MCEGIKKEWRPGAVNYKSFRAATLTLLSEPLGAFQTPTWPRPLLEVQAEFPNSNFSFRRALFRIIVTGRRGGDAGIARQVQPSHMLLGRSR